MKTIISIFSFLIFLVPITFAQDGVRYVKKQPNTSEMKTTSNPPVNNERVVKKDSTNTNQEKNKNINPNPNKTSPNKKN